MCVYIHLRVIHLSCGFGNVFHDYGFLTFFSYLSTRNHLSNNLFFLYIFGKTDFFFILRSLVVEASLFFCKLIAKNLMLSNRTTRKTCWRGRRKFCSMAVLHNYRRRSKFSFMAGSPKKCRIYWSLGSSFWTLCN